MDRNVIKVDILPEDFAKAPHGYHNNYTEGCVMFHALKRYFPDIHVYVGSQIAQIGIDKYRIPKAWGFNTYPSEFPVKKINELSKQAKESLEGIPTVSLTLEPY